MPGAFGEEIQGALKSFVNRWKDYKGTERAEAPTFLNKLFEAYGNPRKTDGERIAFFERVYSALRLIVIVSTSRMEWGR